MKKAGDICKLSELKLNQRGKVIKILVNDKIIKRHLLDMGLTRNVIVEIKKIAPMGDPVDIYLRGYELALRKADLKQIEVEVIE